MSTSNRVKCSDASCHCTFESEESMRQHLKDRHSRPTAEQGKLPCAYCNKSFPTKGGLQEHLRVSHQLSSDEASAKADDVYNVIFPPADFVVPDLQLDREVEDVACNDCGKLFKTTDFLHQHQWDSAYHTRVSESRNPNVGSSMRTCSKCAARFPSADRLEQHYMDRHPISEVSKDGEDGTWQHVEGRFRSAWKKPTTKLHEVHRIFRVYNPGWRRRDFEQYRKELKKEMSHQNYLKEDMDFELRNMVLRDGNELRRYHGTTVKCSLGRPLALNEANITSSLCEDGDCSLCRILEAGFKKSMCRVQSFQRFGQGIYCSSISSKASAYVHCNDITGPSNKQPWSFFSFLSNILGSSSSSNSNTIVEGNYKVMMACKVLAGRPYRTTSNMQKLKAPPAGFHSVQGDPGDKLNYDELVVYDDRAILPDFIILYCSTD